MQKDYQNLGRVCFDIINDEKEITYSSNVPFILKLEDKSILKISNIKEEKAELTEKSNELLEDINSLKESKFWNKTIWNEYANKGAAFLMLYGDVALYEQLHG